MRIVFLGTPQAAVPCLEGLVQAGHQIALVVTQPDRPVKRSEHPLESPVKTSSRHFRIPLIQPTKVRTPEFRSVIEAAAPDVLVTVAYGRILTKQVLDLPRLWAINVHFSLLPKYRGAAPVQWALANSEEITGVTTMLMNERLDEGDILLQEPVRIDAEDHAPQLMHRLALAGASVLLRTLDELEDGMLLPRSQDSSSASFAPPLTRTDGEADFFLSARAIEGRVRGFDPWPGFWGSIAGRRIRIRRARESSGTVSNEPAGKVVGFEHGAFQVVCGDRTLLEVFSVQPESGRELSATDARNGRIVKLGDRFEGTGAAR